MAEATWTGEVLPTVCPETAPFWEACNQSTFLIQRCDSCGKPQYHYRAACSHCWSENVRDLPIAGTGKVWTFSVVNKNLTPAFSAWGRYAVGVIELPEGVFVLSFIDTPDLDNLAIGMDVEVKFKPASNGQYIPYFAVQQ
jgi:uncharacterized protein